MCQYVFNLPIGDWESRKGGIVKDVLIQSRGTLEEIRDAHFKIEEETGVNIHKVADTPGGSYINKDVILKMLENGLNPQAYVVEDFDKDNISDYYYTIYLNVAALWVDLLNKVDEKLELELCLLHELPSIPFKEPDEEGRYISNVGYGTI